MCLLHMADVGEIVASISEHCQAIQEREDREKYEQNEREMAVRNAAATFSQHPPQARQQGRQAATGHTLQPRYVQPANENSFIREEQPSREDVVIVRQDVSA